MTTTMTTTAETQSYKIQKGKALSYYSYHVTTFLKELDSLDDYYRELENIEQRAARMQGLLAILPKASADRLREDIQYDRELYADNVERQKQYLAKKAGKVMRGAERLKEFGIAEDETIITLAKNHLDIDNVKH